MKDNAQKDILLLALAGLVLILVNAAILMGIRNGQIAPADNFVLWSAFAVLSVCSLLWAVSLLGLQPMVVVVAYTAGGLMAYQGVRIMPDVNMAEIATAGATYGAFGALIVGNATTKVRMAFFTKQQVPFIFIIIALLLMNSLLNSCASNAGWNVIANAVVFPFLFCGVGVGLVWVMFTRIRARPVLVKKAAKPVAEEEPVANTAADDEEVAQLMFSVPESAVSTESMEDAVLAHDPESAAEDVSGGTPVPEVVSPLMESAVEEDELSDNFFPLEIDTEEDDLLLADNPNLMGVATMVAESAPEPVVKDDPVEEDVVSHSEESPVSASEPEPVDEPEDQTLEKANSEDWLNGHLDLLNKID